MTKKVSKIIYPTSRSKFHKLLRFFIINWPIFALLFISGLLCFLNFSSGTFLTGWDNLHPEFSPLLNLQRAFFSVWQEYQSTGLLGGMAHAADLPRVFLIYLLSLFHLFPLNFYRYFFTFLPLVLGPLGVYFLLHKIAFKNQDAKTSEVASFLGSLFYLLNLSSLQTFFTPFESFTFFYGSLPWIIFLLARYQSKPRLKTLLFLFLFSLFSTTSYYVETLFICLVFCLISFFLDSYFSHPHKLQTIKKQFTAFLIILLANLFWLLPVIFFVITGGHTNEQAKINLIATPETYFRNLEFGTLPNLLTLKGFWFKFLDLNPSGKFEPLLTPWISHLSSPLIQIISFIFVLFFLVGVFYAFQKKFPLSKTFGLIFGICLFFLLGGGLLINRSIPFVGELFRSPFTKFSTPLALAYAYFFAIGIIFLLDIFSFLDTRLTYNLTLFTCVLLLILNMSPAFSGNFISKSMRITIPTDYFELFKYLDTKPKDQRIANFPQYIFWGWGYNSWGYRGSGFLWYGIKQPILDRAFDVWESTSQNYYEELSSALFSQNSSEFNKVIDKYNVSYLLVDKSVIAPDAKTNLGTNYLLSIISNNPKYLLEKSFGDNIFLYKITSQKSQNFLSTEPLPILTEGQPTSLLTFPFRPNTDWYEKAGFLNANIVIANLAEALPAGRQESPTRELNIPSISDTENLLPYKIEYRKSPSSLYIRFTPITPVFFLNKKQIDLATKPQTVQIPVGALNKKFIINLNSQYFPFELPSEITDFQNYYPITESYLPTHKSFDFGLYYGIPSNQVSLVNSLSNSTPHQCYTNKANRQIEKILSPRSITLLGTDVVACLSTTIPKINTDQLLAISFTYYSPTLTTANVNITDENFGAINTSQPLDPSNTPRQAQIYTKPSNQNKQVNLILEASETKSIQEVTYKDIYLSAHDPIFEASVTLNKIGGKKVPLTETQNNLQISLPITDTQFNINQTAISNALFPENKNCDQLSHGDTVKLVSSDNILYQSRNALECDFLNLRHLDHSLNYLIGIDAQNNKGLALTTCLENHTTKRCDIYERLTNTKATQYLLQPIANPLESAGYTLHLFNQSFGNRITENKLNSITIRPFPLTFLRSIAMLSPDSQSGKNISSTANSILNSSHPTEFLYILSVSAPTTVNLYQTNSPYWKAIVLPESYKNLNPWQLTLKILLNYNSLPQLTPINNGQWYNSYAVSSSNTNLALIYLPQYLEFFGFAIIIITSAFLLIISLAKSLSRYKKAPK